jgi:pimeloyl-ACP methyl ester carboxylesterase
MATNIDKIARQLESLRRQAYGDYITIAGVKLRYLEMGSGSPVILIHGLGGFLEMWWNTILALSTKHRVYAFDMPGHGLSDRPASCYSAAHCTEYLLSIIDALQLEAVTLVGHSLGGAISINAAVTRPDKIANLVLVDSAGLSEKMPLTYRLTAVPLFGEVVLKLAWKYVSRQGVKRLFEQSAVVSRETLATVLAIAQRPGTEEGIHRILHYNIGLIRAHRDSLVTLKLQLLKACTLLIHGAHDRVFPLDNVRDAYHNIPNSRLIIIPNCGHSPHIEKPAEFNEAVVRFLEATEAGSSTS